MKKPAPKKAPVKKPAAKKIPAPRLNTMSEAPVNSLGIAPRPRMGATPAAPSPVPMAEPPAFKCGGKVKKTGMAMVHKGEQVLTKKQAKKKGY